jgi:uncharacterized protein (TIGR00159 family)
MDFITSIFEGLKTLDFVFIAVDTIIVSYVIYRILLLIKGTPAVQMLLGLTLLIILFVISKEEYLRLTTLNWLLDNFISSFILIVIIIFQNDIRRALTKIGQNPIFRGSKGEVTFEASLEEIVKACAMMVNRKLGAIIAIEQDADLSEYGQHGVIIDASINKALLFSIFVPSYQNPLHDGAVIIQAGRIRYAACFLPLSMNPNIEKSLGTRHRAAIGLSEETDAVVIVVSEETNKIRIARKGEISEPFEINNFRAELSRILKGEDLKKTDWIERLKIVPQTLMKKIRSLRQ